MEAPVKTTTRRGLTVSEITLLIEIVGVALLGTLWWLNTALQSPWPEGRAHAARRLHDPALLQSLALHDGHEMVRQAAVARVADAQVLARVALSDPAPFVRRAAAERIQDQAVLAKFALQESNDTVRGAVVERLQDPVVLLDLARGPGEDRFRERVLARIKADSLLRAASAATDSEQRARLQVAAQLLRAVDALPLPPAERPRIALALLPLASRFSQPPFVARFGAVQSMTLEWRPLSQSYGRQVGYGAYSPYGQTHTVSGEAITLAVRVARRPVPLTMRWATSFPSSVHSGQSFIKAAIDPAAAVPDK